MEEQIKYAVSRMIYEPVKYIPNNSDVLENETYNFDKAFNEAFTNIDKIVSDSLIIIEKFNTGSAAYAYKASAKVLVLGTRVSTKNKKVQGMIDSVSDESIETDTADASLASANSDPWLQKDLMASLTIMENDKQKSEFLRNLMEKKELAMKKLTIANTNISIVSSKIMDLQKQIDSRNGSLVNRLTATLNNTIHLSQKMFAQITAHTQDYMILMKLNRDVSYKSMDDHNERIQAIYKINKMTLTNINLRTDYVDGALNATEMVTGNAVRQLASDLVGQQKSVIQSVRSLLNAKGKSFKDGMFSQNAGYKQLIDSSGIWFGFSLLSGFVIAKKKRQTYNMFYSIAKKGGLNGDL